MSVIKICFLIIAVAAINNGFAQECTNTNVLGIPGKWKQGMKGASDHSAADMIKEKAIMDDVMQFIRTNLKWSPVGGDITYNNIYSINGQDYRPKPTIKICNSYHTELWFQQYYCDNGKIGRQDFSISLNVQFNKMPFIFSESFFVTGKNKDGYNMEQDPGTDVYAYIEILPVEKNEQFDFEEGAGKTFRYRYRTLTKSGKLPYVVMRKKEYYEKWKMKHGKAIEGLQQNIIDIAKQEQEIGNNDVSKICLQTIGTYKSYIKKIDAILQSKSAEDLAKPALAGEENGEYFEGGGKENSKYYVIKPDASYHNSKLPKNSPQVITIALQYAVNEDNSGNEHYKDEIFYKAIESSKIIDLLAEKLKPMIVQ
jgi:hypothetical protein